MARAPSAFERRNTRGGQLPRFFSREAGQERSRNLREVEKSIMETIRYYGGPGLGDAFIPAAVNTAAELSPGADFRDAVLASDELVEGMKGLDPGDTMRGLGGLGMASLGMFLGPAAKVADHAALEVAEGMARHGDDAQRIWDETGWFQGADGKWRFEIDDSEAGLRLGETDEVSGPLGEVVDHPALFEAYPDLASISTQADASQKYPYNPSGGIYSPFEPREHLGLFDLQEDIYAKGDTPENLRGTLLHEGQHAVQRREGFAVGGNQSIGQELSAGKPETAYDAYRRIAGEVEARNVETRRGYTPDQRRATPPWTTEDIPRDQQIVRFGGGVQASEPVNTIRAYHGTPHDFDRFDLGKIGTGEGAQAYGRGLYFAEKEGVGRSYRDSLTLRRNQQNPPGEHDALALEMVGSHGEDTAKRLLGGAIGHAGSNTAKADRLRGALKSIEEGTYKPWTSKGHMYEVDIKADPATFLDWDKPLSEQGELGAKVRALGSDASDVRIEPRDRGGFRVSWVDKTTGPQSTVFETEKQAEGFAESALNPPDSFAALRSRTELSEEELADALREAGVPGVRFLDQMSRDAGEGTYNYAVWDDKIIDIVRKYGIGALLMGGAGVAASGGRDDKNQGGA